MSSEEIGVYRGYLVIVEHDHQGWCAKATTAGSSVSRLSCWSPSREAALNLIRTSINQTVNEGAWPELAGPMRLP